MDAHWVVGYGIEEKGGAGGGRGFGLVSVSEVGEG